MRAKNSSEAALLIYLLMATAGAAMIGGGLYAAFRPTVLPNPGLAAYRAPIPDPIVPRAAAKDDDAERVRLTIAAVRHENELLGLEATTSFASASVDSEPIAKTPQSVKQKQKRSRQVQSRRVPEEPNRWVSSGVDWSGWSR